MGTQISIAIAIPSLSLSISMELLMTPIRHTLVFIALASCAWGATAQTATEHTQHHPAEVTKKLFKPYTPKPPSVAMESTIAMDSKIKTMREMHEKMMAAKTPEERKALMGDHMKAMQDGMDMMATMDAKSGMAGMGADAKKVGMSTDMMGMHDMMHKRVEMMTTMMQMMMDRLPSTPVP